MDLCGRGRRSSPSARPSELGPPRNLSGTTNRRRCFTSVRPLLPSSRLQRYQRGLQVFADRPARPDSQQVLCSPRIARPHTRLGLRNHLHGRPRASTHSSAVRIHPPSCCRLAYARDAREPPPCYRAWKSRLSFCPRLALPCLRVASPIACAMPSRQAGPGPAGLDSRAGPGWRGDLIRP